MVKESNLQESRKQLSANVISIPSSDSEDTPITRCKHTAEAAKLSVMSDDIRGDEGHHVKGVSADQQHVGSPRSEKRTL